MPSELRKAIDEVIRLLDDPTQQEDRNLYIFMLKDRISHLKEVYEPVKEKL